MILTGVRAVFPVAPEHRGMHVEGVRGLPEIAPGADLARLIGAHATVAEGDVVCVSSTVVSKAEDRYARLADYDPGPRARAIAERLEAVVGEQKDPRFAQAVLEESEAVLIEAPFLLTVTGFGHVGVNAGIDRSNVGPEGELLLLPERPSASAQRIRKGLGGGCAVIVTDTCGRPFRYGQHGVAIGWAGIPANRDWRGEQDRDGYVLRTTVQCVVDELAGAANLVMGEGDLGTPVVVVRGWSFGSYAGYDEVFRAAEDDYVRQALRGWSYAGD